MALEDLTGWIERAELAVGTFLEGPGARLGYELDSNVIVRQNSELKWKADSPHYLQVFFSAINELSWPDIWNGYFVGPPSQVADRTGRVHSLGVGAEQRPAIQIGSDGGGAFFLIDLSDEDVAPVLRVLEPSLQDGVVHGEQRTIATDFDNFLESLIENVALVAQGNRPRF